MKYSETDKFFSSITALKTLREVAGMIQRLPNAR
jgi:hypothetical protein